MAIDDGLLYEAPVRVKYYPDGSTFLIWEAPDGVTVQIPWEDDPEGVRPRSEPIVEPKAEPNWKDLTVRLFYALRSHRKGVPQKLETCGICAELLERAQAALDQLAEEHR